MSNLLATNSTCSQTDKFTSQPSFSVLACLMFGTDPAGDVMSHDDGCCPNPAAAGCTGSVTEIRQTGQATKTAAVILPPTMTGSRAIEAEHTAILTECTETQEVDLAAFAPLPELIYPMSITPTCLIAMPCLLLIAAQWSDSSRNKAAKHHSRSSWL